jgi:hypothetical protein
MALDTLTISKRLQSAGFSASQADAVTAVIHETGDPAARDLVTRKDLQIELAPIRSDIGLLKWMVGVNSALTVGVLLKLFLA